MGWDLGIVLTLALVALVLAYGIADDMAIKRELDRIWKQLNRKGG